MKKSFGPKALIFPTPVWCVGSYDGNGDPNVMTIAWGGFVVQSRHVSPSPFAKPLIPTVIS